MRCSIGEWLTQARVGALDGEAGEAAPRQQPNNKKKQRGLIIAHKNTAAVPKTWAKSGGRPENKMLIIADYQFQFLRIHAYSISRCIWNSVPNAC